MRKTLPLILAALAACGPFYDEAAPGNNPSYPSERLTWMIPFGPGGGSDLMVRTLIEILEAYDMYPEAIVPLNRPGGSGAQGWGQVFERRGDPYHITTISGSFFALPLQADVPWTPTDFTPVALLAAEDLVLWVSSDSEIDTFERFVELARSDPPAIGGVGAFSVDFISVLRLGKEAGFEPRFVAFNRQGALATAVLSGSLVTVVATPAEGQSLFSAGELRPLAYFGSEPPEWLSHVPTLDELGFQKAGVSTPRGLILPPEVDPAAQAWWIETLKQVVQTPEWTEFLESGAMRAEERYGDDFGDYLDELSRSFTEVYTELGVLRR